MHGAYLELHRCWAPKRVSAEGEGEDMKSTKLYLEGTWRQPLWPPGDLEALL